jgi:malate/lactate dehydrogenase
MTSEKVAAGIKGSIQELNESGYEADLCWIDFGQTAIQTIEKFLSAKSYEAVLIGAGIRKAESNFLLFEKIINAIHEHAPKARLCFNTNPKDTVAAVQRWA